MGVGPLAVASLRCDVSSREDAVTGWMLETDASIMRETWRGDRWNTPLV